MPDDITALRERVAADADAGQTSVYTPHGSPAVGITGTETGGGMVFYDADGELRSQLP